MDPPAPLYPGAPTPTRRGFEPAPRRGIASPARSYSVRVRIDSNVRVHPPWRSHVGGGRAALVRVDEVAREDILGLGVLELRLPLEVPVEHGPKSSTCVEEK